MTRGIAKRQGRPAHELFEGRTLQPVTNAEWSARNRLEKPSLIERVLGWGR
jgi:hypothetical protein